MRLAGIMWQSAGALAYSTTGESRSPNRATLLINLRALVASSIYGIEEPVWNRVETKQIAYNAVTQALKNRSVFVASS
jgi:hypothetical protein